MAAIADLSAASVSFGYLQSLGREGAGRAFDVRRASQLAAYNRGNAQFAQCVAVGMHVHTHAHTASSARRHAEELA